MPTTMPFLPRIYSIRLRSAGAGASLNSAIERCAVLGFDHVLLVRDPGETAEPDDLRAIAQAAGRHKLNVLLDLDIGSIGSDPVLLERYPDWFERRGSNDDLPDPRRDPLQEIRRVPRYGDKAAFDSICGYWQQRLENWVAAGIAGFRCTSVAEPPPALWSCMISAMKGRRPDVRFLAWTPGCTPQQMDALAGCGFDASFSSGAWWDYRSRWLLEEDARLQRVAPPIAFPDSPNEAVIERLAGNEEPEARRRIYQRALRLAAATGNGILVPQGFESGTPGDSAYRGEQDAGGIDLSTDLREANTFIAESGARFYRGRLRMMSTVESGIAVLLRESASPDGEEALLMVANSDPMRACAVSEGQLLERAGGFVRERKIWPAAVERRESGKEPAGSSEGMRDSDRRKTVEHGAKQKPHDSQAENAPPVALEAADFQLFLTRRLPPILARQTVEDVSKAAQSPRIAIEAISPACDEGRFPVKRTVGEVVSIEADVFVDGHDKLAVALLWRTADQAEWQETRMHFLSNDRWAAPLALTRIGRYLFAVEAWKDVFATYRDELEKKTAAGLNVSVELEEGRLLVQAAADHAESKGISSFGYLKSLANSLKTAASDAERVTALLSEPTAEAMRLADARPFAVRGVQTMRIEVERTAARFSSWYELFPRSQSGDPARHGTFDDVIKRLPAIQAMGFDTLYFPPIHPIGSKHRKGRNNSLTPGPDDPGSPYAIGAEEGGHDAIHPQLGTLEDFRRLRDEAARHGLELALDFAIQCSPDHPWLKDHPDWFAWRPDGTIRYAENPPKKYQDIVNVDFYANGAIPGLWTALRDVVLFWVNEGVKVFRVDNPHTKPLPFWEWMIGEVKARHPDTIFLSEAFTRPKMMYRLAKVGYSQSYTYFTWRHTKEEFTEYLTELSQSPVKEFFRPHFFVNTPDINPVFLQKSGRPGFLIRTALATTLSGLWGMYSGFELCEATPVPGKEEYLDSEKYEIRAWDWQRPGNIIQEITLLNRIRKENPALQTHLNIRFLPASNDNILFYIKTTPPADSCERFGDNVVMVAVNLDPFNAHEATLELPLWEFGVPDDGVLEVEDLVNGNRFGWHGKYQPLRLDPFVCPYAIWRVRHTSQTSHNSQTGA